MAEPVDESDVPTHVQRLVEEAGRLEHGHKTHIGHQAKHRQRLQAELLRAELEVEDEAQANAQVEGADL